MSCVEKQFMSWNVLDSGIVSSVPFFISFFCFRIESFQMISNWVNYRGEFVEKANHQRKNGRKKAEFVFRNSNSTDFEADTIAVVVVVVIDIVDLKIEECKKSFKTRDIWLFRQKYCAAWLESESEFGIQFCCLRRTIEQTMDKKHYRNDKHNKKSRVFSVTPRTISQDLFIIFVSLHIFAKICKLNQRKKTKKDRTRIKVRRRTIVDRSKEEIIVAQNFTTVQCSETWAIDL